MRKVAYILLFDNKEGVQVYENKGYKVLTSLRVFQI